MKLEEIYQQVVKANLSSLMDLLKVRRKELQEVDILITVQGSSINLTFEKIILGQG